MNTKTSGNQPYEISPNVNVSGAPKAKPDTSRASDLLTPSEIESLRRHAKEQSKQMKEILKNM